mmetsp:Transcript_44021/g.68831  ORF Transcript_44021/g.68831 Transcript_44021/m.68831 type:complete len:115 (+) Transcript_44021:185-529(+)
MNRIVCSRVGQLVKALRPAAFSRAFASKPQAEYEAKGANRSLSDSRECGLSRWDDSRPFATVETFRTSSPFRGFKPLDSLSDSTVVHWDDGRPFNTAKAYRKPSKEFGKRAEAA